MTALAPPPVSTGDGARPPMRAALRRPQWLPDQVSVLVLLAVALCVLPRLLNSLLAPKFRVSVGTAVEGSPWATRATFALTVAVLVWCLTIVLTNIRHLPRERSWPLVALLAPWVYLVVRDIYVDLAPTPGTLLFPLVAVAFWVLAPPGRVLVPVGLATAAVAVLSVALALLLPSQGLFTNSAGQLITPEKQILPWGVLIGILTSGNGMGQLLVLGLPFVVLIRRRSLRLQALALVGVCLLWTSARGSLAGAGYALAVYAALRLAPLAARAAVAMAAMLAPLALAALVPLLTTDDAAFTNRGWIWQISLGASEGDRAVGLGSPWYSRVAKFVNQLPETAYHGHNLVVHSLVIGGVVYLVLLGVMLVPAVLNAARWAGHGLQWPAVFLCLLFAGLVLETPFGLVDRSALFFVTLLPLCCLTFWSPPLRTAGSRLARRPPTVGGQRATDADRATIDAWSAELWGSPRQGRAGD